MLFRGMGRGNRYKKLSMQRNLDKVIGSALCSVFALRNSVSKRHFPKKVDVVLFLKLSAIGDAILSLPMMKKAKEATKCRIVVVCSKENCDVFEGQKFIDRIILSDTGKLNPISIFNKVKEIRREHADLVIDAGQSAYLSAALASMAGRYSIGFKNNKARMRNKALDKSLEQNIGRHVVFNYFDLISPLGIYPDEDEVRLVKMSYGEDNQAKSVAMIRGAKGIVGVHPCNALDYREWPKERFAEVISNLVNRYDKKVVIVGGKDEAEKVEHLMGSLDEKTKKSVIDVAGKMGIKDLAALSERFELFIANDGGPMHIAASMGVPTIGIFGRETPERYAPFNSRSVSVYKKIKCSPCYRSYDCYWVHCEDALCLKEISAKDVLDEVEKILGNRR